MTENYPGLNPQNTGQTAVNSRSQTVSTLRKLTGEIVLPGPESDQSDRLDGAGKSLAVAAPLLGVSVIVFLISQQMNYARQTESAVEEGTVAQVVRAIDQASTRRRSQPSFTFPRQSVSTSLPAGVANPLQDTTPAMTAVKGGPIEQQLNLADRLAYRGAFDASASILRSALADHNTNTELRIAAIRAELRIRDYNCARQLCEEGVSRAVCLSDRNTFSHLLNSIPNS